MRRTDTSLYDTAAKSLLILKAISEYDAAIRPSLVNRMQKLAEEFDAIRRSTRNIVPKLVQMYKSRYAYHTIALEGNTLSLGETELVIEQGITIRGKSLREHLEAKNIPEALQVVLGIAKTAQQPITVGDILDMHKLVMQGIDNSSPGQFRRGFVGITGTSYIPPPAYEIQPQIEAMLDCVNHSFSNKKGKRQLGAFETAFKAHLWLVSIHPFYDGNGRVARLLAGLILLRYGYPPMIIRNEHRRRYTSTIKQAQLSSNFKLYYEFMSDEFISTLTAYILSAKQESSEDMTMPLVDAARSYGLSSDYLGLLARNGAISAFKEGKLWFVRKKDIEDYVSRRKRRDKLHQL